MLNLPLDKGHYISGFIKFQLAEDSRLKVDSLEDQNVAVICEIQENESVLFIDVSHATNCYVIAVGDDALSYQQEKTADSILERLDLSKVTSQTASLSEEEYKERCVEYTSSDYEDILRNLDKHKKKLVKFSGEIAQIIEGWFGSYTFAVTDSSGNKWKISYSYEEGESHFLEGDSITVYGEIDGTTTSTTVLGKQVVTPDINAKYIE